MTLPFCRTWGTTQSSYRAGLMMRSRSYKGFTVKQVQRLDYLAIERVGIPSVVLMENAGRAVAAEALKLLKKKHRARAASACVLCGLGNNAGDGFVAARHLRESGVDTCVYLIGSRQRLKKDAALNYSILRKLKHKISCAHRVDGTLRSDIARADIVIDALFGVGLNRNIHEPFFSIIKAVNKDAKKVFAVDVPSGLEGTNGKIYGVCVRADCTVTFSAPKQGFFRNDGPRYTGKIVVADIGIPKTLKKKLS